MFKSDNGFKRKGTEESSKQNSDLGRELASGIGHHERPLVGHAR